MVRLSTSLLIALSFRLFNALVSRTFFQPDEYWQALEVAHRLVFGYGYQSWEWRHAAVGAEVGVKELLAGGGGGGIRSPLYPFLFVPLFWVLSVTGLDDPVLLTLAPRLVQAVIAAATDLAVKRLATRLIGRRYGNAAIFCSNTSFFNFHASTRTFSNSMETALTTLALAWWPWEDSPSSEAAAKGHAEPSRYESSSLAVSLSFAAVASIMRPSSAVLWLFLGLHLLVTSRTVSRRLGVLFTTLTISAIAALGCLALDTRFYQTPTFTPLRFLHQNVFNSISLFYGANPFHFYLTQALPLMTLTQLPFVLHGLYLVFWRRSARTGRPGLRVAGQAVGVTVAIYSLLGHKEWRFVHPLLPVLHLFAALSLVNLYATAPYSSYLALPHLPIRPLHALILAISLGPALYLTAFHCKGQVDVIHYLATLPVEELRSVGFLMPCHSTPWQSHLHRRELEVEGGGSGEGGRAWFITCEPPVLGQDPTTYLDQSDVFYASPISYLHTRFPHTVNPSFPPSPFPSAVSLPPPSSSDLNWRHEWPSHIVVFQALLEEVEEGKETVGEVLRRMGYAEERRLWNSHWHEDERRRGNVVVLRWKGGAGTTVS
ncbi:Alg9-like mannosyltransferase family-domain-containing protein [Leucosporidium creatinivorum]|uniref:Mannosyltransferase n=1 Tax=Leucosporidium creatinivorum TaxID=106004 RepID=A0A1Y2F2C3_9BASI|nr:Alg9-like mannosyltransferase family-domain-containing protein [Leucosporidium creatinivorum]